MTMDDPTAPDELHAMRTQLAEATEELTSLRAQYAALRQEHDIELLDREWSAAQETYEVDALVGSDEADGGARYIPTRGHGLGCGVLVAIPMILFIVYAPREFTWLAALFLAGVVWWTVDAVRKADAYEAAETDYLRRRAQLNGEATEPRSAESPSGESALEPGMSMSTDTPDRTVVRFQRAFRPTTALATDVAFDDAMMRVTLADGREICVPIIWFPPLHAANRAQREHFEIDGGGISIHWPDIDEDISVAGLLDGADPAST